MCQNLVCGTADTEFGVCLGPLTVPNRGQCESNLDCKMAGGGIFYFENLYTECECANNGKLEKFCNRAPGD